jgi:hypothetical protein
VLQLVLIGQMQADQPEADCQQNEASQRQDYLGDHPQFLAGATPTFRSSINL